MSDRTPDLDELKAFHERRLPPAAMLRVDRRLAADPASRAALAEIARAGSKARAPVQAVVAAGPLITPSTPILRTSSAMAPAGRFGPGRSRTRTGSTMSTPAGKIYFLSLGRKSRVMSINDDGSDPQVLIDGLESKPDGIGVDAALTERDDVAVLVAAGVREGHDALPRPALRLALVGDHGLGVERVAVEQRFGEGDLGEAEVADDGALGPCGFA